MSVKICPPDHAHERSLTCHSTHGCRCTPCKAARSEYDGYRQRAAGGSNLIPAAPTVRRLRALARHGWTAVAISEKSGINKEIIKSTRLAQRPRVRASTAQAIAEFYTQHALEKRSGRYENRARNTAKENGWPSPLDWEDIERGILG